MIELLYFISYSIGYKYTNTITEATFSISTQLEKQFLSFAMKCVDFLNNIFQEATVEIRVKIFYDIIKVLGSALITKFTRIGYSSNFWILSLSTFIDIIKLGLEDLNRSGITFFNLFFFVF